MEGVNLEIYTCSPCITHSGNVLFVGSGHGVPAAQDHLYWGERKVAHAEGDY